MERNADIVQQCVVDLHTRKKERVRSLAVPWYQCLLHVEVWNSCIRGSSSLGAAIQ